MVVNFTANIGLAKPDETEVAENWVNSVKLAEDNNIIIADETDIVTSTYTPTLVGQVTPPSIGAGSITGEYQECQGMVWGSFFMIFVDPGVAVGSGEYGVSLPFQADGSFHAASGALNTGVGSFSCIGEGYIRDDNVVNNCGTVALELVTIGATSYVRLVTETFAGKTSRLFRDAMPFSVAHADSIAGNFFYKRA